MHYQISTFYKQLSLKIFLSRRNPTGKIGEHEFEQQEESIIIDLRAVSACEASDVKNVTELFNIEPGRR